MAQNLKINGKQYNGVSVIGAPSVNGGTTRFYDTSNSTAIADDIALGKTAYINGGKIVGTSQGGATLGTKTITSNGEYDAQDDGYDGYSSVDVQVPGSSPTLQAKTNISPTTSSQTITPDVGYDGLSSVQINAMPSGTAGTPTATKGAVSNHSISVTPSVTNTTGYITGSTINGTAVTVSASELDSGSKSITANGNSQDVVGYASVDVAVPNSYSASDEGKVVSSGALVAQTAHADVTPTTSDQTIDTTTNNSIKVKGDANLVAGNIKKDVVIFNTTGSYEGGSSDDAYKFLDDSFSGDYVNNSITKLRNYALNYYTGHDFTFSSTSVTSLGYNVFQNSNLTSFSAPNLSGTGNNGSAFNSAQKVTFLDLGSLGKISSNFAYNARKLTTVVLRNTSVVTLDNTNAFGNTPIRGYNSLSGTIYVPQSLIASYKTASNWSSIFNEGHVTFSAIEGSIYA